MTGIIAATPTRRALLAGAASASALLLLPACASTGPAFTMEEAVRRLLLAAADNAFARLTAPGAADTRGLDASTAGLLARLKD